METKKGYKSVSQTNETKSSKNGTKENETRATFIVNDELLDKLKALAYWERCLIKDLINEAIQDLVNKYEKFNGFIKPVPEHLTDMGNKIEGVKFYTVAQIAIALNVAQKTVRKWIKEGKLKGQKIENLILVTENNLREFLQTIN